MENYHRKRTKLIAKSPFEDVQEELIHHIQSFLPGKEAARTCILSKSWLHAWLTIPNLNFPFKSISHVEYKNFIDHTLLRYRSNNIPIQSFHLGIAITNEETNSLAENWIRHVSNPKTCLEELSLDILVDMGLDRFTLPLEIFSSENLKSITVTTSFIGDVQFYNSLCSNPMMIKCVSLRVLDLDVVSITDKELANLLSTCKLLEKISLVTCKHLKTIKVKNLAFLRELKIHLLESNHMLEITGVPVLRMFDYRLSRFVAQISKPMPFQMDSLGSVTRLIIGHLLMDDGFFNTIKSKLPLLESLTLRTEKLEVENCVISSVSLKRLKLKFYTTKQFVITVCAPKLISCICKCRGPAPLISFATTTPVHFMVRSFY